MCLARWAKKSGTLVKKVSEYRKPARIPRKKKKEQHTHILQNGNVMGREMIFVHVSWDAFATRYQLFRLSYQPVAAYKYQLFFLSYQLFKLKLPIYLIRLPTSCMQNIM